MVFEPASQRIQDQDVLLRGPEILDLFETVYAQVNMSSELKLQILNNRLSKIRQMLDMFKVPDDLILTKFFDKVWRRYAYVSNIGELFLDLPTFISFLPDLSKDKSSLYALRLDDLDDDTQDDEDDESEDDESEDDESEDDELKESDAPPAAEESD